MTKPLAWMYQHPTLGAVCSLVRQTGDHDAGWVETPLVSQSERFFADSPKAPPGWPHDDAAPPSPIAEPVMAVSVSTLERMFESTDGIDKNQWGFHWRRGWNDAIRRAMDYSAPIAQAQPAAVALTFDVFRRANVARCIKWHPEGIASWSSSDWLTAVTGELGELASLLKMRNRERDGLPGNKFSPTDKMVADELADVLTYLDLLAEVMGVDLGRAAVEKFNEVSERVGFPDRILLSVAQAQPAEQQESLVPTAVEVQNTFAQLLREAEPGKKR